MTGIMTSSTPTFSVKTLRQFHGTSLVNSVAFASRRSLISIVLVFPRGELGMRCMVSGWVNLGIFGNKG
ncbi:hypothetical protein SLEP1_g14958 [Rubroshorea leprosula]|uniref:Uncharacterized protein n=1 Tax=Rubroshorea leprosula TaxID=152421 RepID=A0AAV5IVB4_9ROSI|nr:hypothetical protein SLEP1_g14958 [Rubroshorea leprosula]